MKTSLNMRQVLKGRINEDYFTNRYPSLILSTIDRYVKAVKIKILKETSIGKYFGKCLESVYKT